MALLKKCACGGKLHYEKGSGDYISIWCDRCTPVVEVREPCLPANAELEQVIADAKLARDALETAIKNAEDTHD